MTITRRPRGARAAIHVAVAALAITIIGLPAGAHDAPTAVSPDAAVAPADGVITSTPFRPEVGPQLQPQGAGAPDPLGLLLYPNEVRRHSLGEDVYEVWECPDAGPVPISVGSFVAQAEQEMDAYFGWASDGRYDPDFIVGGVVPNGEPCDVWAANNATGSANAALFIRNTTGGFAGPGFHCAFGGTCPDTYPENRRAGFIGVAGSSGPSWTTLAHEMGHMLHWPHSYTRASGSQYDNAIDLMSGNYNLWTVGGGTRYGSYPDPYSTTPLNRYAAGWIDPDDIALWSGFDQTVVLNEVGRPGDQAFVVDVGGHFYILGARIQSPQDPFRPEWEGVEVYKVRRCSSCWSLDTDVRPEPATPFDWSNRSSYTKPLDHVLQVGESITLGDAELTVSGASATSFTVSVAGAGPPPPPSRFRDVPASHLFHASIEWLADEGVTKGCNPPTNDRFCPDDYVTRGQMAAFLARAFGWSGSAGGDLFADDDDSVFERDIDLLGTAGVTKGCNPPGNTRFCPDDYVTRGEMAAFLDRAFN